MSLLQCHEVNYCFTHFFGEGKLELTLRAPVVWLSQVWTQVCVTPFSDLEKGNLACCAQSSCGNSSLHPFSVPRLKEVVLSISTHEIQLPLCKTLIPSPWSSITPFSPTYMHTYVRTCIHTCDIHTSRWFSLFLWRTLIEIFGLRIWSFEQFT